jgi:CubicO group peptidase (beta-lactamase class C family)
MSLSDRLHAAVARAGIVGAVAGVLVGDERESAAAGLADVSTGRELRPDSRIPVASLTKPMVATTAVRRWQRDRRPLDAPLVELRPELAPHWRADRRIGLHHLLSHTSGLRPDVDPSFTGTLAQAVRETIQVGQTYRLGAAWQYCNAGYALAGYALAGSALGAVAPFEETMAAELFGPAGMTSTGFDGAEAVGHTGGQPVRGTYRTARRPGGDVVSTVDDLLAFARFALADPASFAATGRAVAASDLGARYGLGWVLSHGGRVRWHAGDWGGCHSALMLVPERRMAVAVVVNDDAGEPLRLDLGWRELHRAGGPGRPRIMPAVWLASAIARRGLARGLARGSARGVSR